MSWLTQFFRGCPWGNASEHLLKQIIANQEKIMATLDEVLAKVEQQDTALDSVRALIAGLRQQLEEALSGAALSPANQAKVDAIFAALDKNSAEISDALAANVPPSA